jgi:hypothetical protein
MTSDSISSTNNDTVYSLVLCLYTLFLLLILTAEPSAAL